MPAADREKHVSNAAAKEFVKVMGSYFADLQKAVEAGAQVKVSLFRLCIPPISELTSCQIVPSSETLAHECCEWTSF